MNGTYYKNPTFPAADDNNYQDNPVEDVEINEERNDILINNIGKKVNIFANYLNSNESKNTSHSGIIENNKKDYLIISNPTSGKWYLIPHKYINYIEFEEKINY